MRTAPLVKMDELDMPGPAHYQKGTEDYGENHEGIYKKPLKSSHMFSSTTGRLYTPPKIVTVRLSYVASFIFMLSVLVTQLCCYMCNTLDIGGGCISVQ